MADAKKKKLRIVLAGGGTAGHFYPLLAVAVEFQILAGEKNIELELYYIGEINGRYRELFTENGILIRNILAGKLRRYLSLSNLVDLPKFIIGLIQSWWHLFWLMPDAVFSKGGPGALSVIFPAVFYRIPVFIHESDTAPGLTNRLSAGFSKIIFLAFAEAGNYLPKNREKIVVGNPLRRYLVTDIPQKEPTKKFLGFESDLPLLLVLGGSQGATRLNDIVLENLKILLQDFQIFHQTGETNYEKFEEQAKPILREIPAWQRGRYLFVGFLEDDLKDALAASDLIISRAGSGAISEIAAFGKPSILIPLPEAAGDHQRLNAYAYASTGAAAVIEEKDFSPEAFIAQIKKILGDDSLMRSMFEKARASSRPEAASQIARKIIELS